ncbi:MAG: hypothetical protein QNJ60_04955 [Xenococcaceae cyanobacterium MO_188.B19]|nr:hypothetical protein [Xenococcaceae cyanobacterium MO_188.B19]
MNLDEYITKFERGDFGFQELQKIAKNQSINRIVRLYGSYGEAKKIGFYDHDSLRWILFFLEKELKFAGFERAASLLKIDVNDSFASFWHQFEERNGVVLPTKATK